MKHKILSGTIEEVTEELNKIELDWDIEVISSAFYRPVYIVIIKTLRPKY